MSHPDGYTVSVLDIDRYSLGEQPNGCWVVAIDRERSEITWAFPFQVIPVRGPQQP